MAKKETTIGDLAEMIKEDFAETNEKRLSAMEAELMDIKEELKRVIYRREFERLEERVNNLERRLEMAIKNNS